MDAIKIEDAIQSTFASPQVKAVINLRYTANYIGGLQNALMAEFGLTMPQFNILRILRGAKKEITVNTIKERMIEKSPNTTRLMDKLIDKNLIERMRCKNDRRVVYIKITSEGLRLLEIIDVKLKEEGSLLTPISMSDEEANLLSDLLDKLRAHVNS